MINLRRRNRAKRRAARSEAGMKDAERQATMMLLTGRPAADNVSQQEVLITTLHLHGWIPVKAGQGGIMHRGYNLVIYVDTGGALQCSDILWVEPDHDVWPRYSVLVHCARHFDKEWKAVFA